MESFNISDAFSYLLLNIFFELGYVLGIEQIGVILFCVVCFVGAKREYCN